MSAMTTKKKAGNVAKPVTTPQVPEIFRSLSPSSGWPEIDAVMRKIKAQNPNPGAGELTANLSWINKTTNMKIGPLRQEWTHLDENLIVAPIPVQVSVSSDPDDINHLSPSSGWPEIRVVLRHLKTQNPGAGQLKEYLNQISAKTGKTVADLRTEWNHLDQDEKITAKKVIDDACIFLKQNWEIYTIVYEEFTDIVARPTSGGIFNRRSWDTDLENQVIAYLHEIGLYSPDITNKIWAVLRATSPQLTEDDFDSNPDEIAFVDGVYDCSNRTFREYLHTDKFFLRLSHNFKKGGENQWGQVEDFLKTAVPEKYIELCWITFGYIISNHRDLRKAPVLQGTKDGNNGKNVFLNIVRAGVGKQLFEQVPFVRLCDKFGTWATVGKKLVYCAEITDLDAKQVGIFKDLITNDLRPVEPKGKKPRSVRVFDKFWIDCNGLFGLPKNSGSLRKRFYLIPFPNEYFCRNEVLTKSKQLTNEQVILDSIHHALDVYLDFRRDYGTFDTYFIEKLGIDLREHNKSEWDDNTRSMETFVNERCETSDLWTNHQISKEDFVIAFKKWHEDKGVYYDDSYWKMTRITRTLKNMIPDLKSTNKMYGGIRLKTNEQHEQHEHPSSPLPFQRPQRRDESLGQFGGATDV